MAKIIAAYNMMTTIQSNVNFSENKWVEIGKVNVRGLAIDGDMNFDKIDLAINLIEEVAKCYLAAVRIDGETLTNFVPEDVYNLKIAEGDEVFVYIENDRWLKYAPQTTGAYFGIYGREGSWVEVFEFDSAIYTDTPAEAWEFLVRPDTGDEIVKNAKKIGEVHKSDWRDGMYAGCPILTDDFGWVAQLHFVR